ncbi:MAG TPA: hypothetical protein VGR56_09420 [Nitrososphaerales archaeon]|nr:hypothetical protein [Nitrososphaerales archaeon]
MYLRNLLVVALCTAFVVGFVVVLNYATAGVGRQGQTGLVTTQTTSCASQSQTCLSFSITSARLVSMNYTDVLGPGNYATLTLGLNTSGGSPLTSVKIFVGNQSAGTFQGPFQPGVNKMLNLTLPATISVSSGKIYTISIEGFFDDGTATVWESAKVTAS